MKNKIENIKRERRHFTSLLSKSSNSDQVQRIQAKITELDQKLSLFEHTPDSALEGPLLNVMPDTNTVYVAFEAAQAAKLAQSGYPACVCSSAEDLKAFKGSDVVLTDARIFSWAFDLSNQFNVVQADCWQKGVLDVLNNVPMMTHLLTLAETIDLIPIQSSKLGKQAQAIYKAFGNDDQTEYRRLVKGLVAA